MSWLSDTRMSLDIQNLFNGYRRVTFDDASVAMTSIRWGAR